MSENFSLKMDADKKYIYPVETLSSLFRRHSGEDPDSIVRLTGGGSQRDYYRISSARCRAVGTYTSDEREASRFIRISKILRECDVAVPEVYMCDCHGAYLQEDLGDVSLFSVLGSADAERYVADTMHSLARMQCTVSPRLVDMDLPVFDNRLIRWDLNYFKYSFLKPSGISFDEYPLQDDFDRLETDLMTIADHQQGFMYRDCQSRNVMIHKGKPYWIDFQGAMKGPAAYDVVSFLWQAKACFSNDFRKRMLAEYADEYVRLRPEISREQLLESVPVFALFRTLQVLGAYGFRGLVEHKSHFVESIPYGIKNLAGLAATEVFSTYPSIGKIAMDLSRLKRFNPAERLSGKLRVEVISFSYKKGYPENLTGNGGGFMFDCRAVHNPGRYAEYKSLTGMDSGVVEFLEKQPETAYFRDAVWRLTDPAVERYIKRGFTNLQIGFGCTGGQHRSVYFAEVTARHIARNFPDAEVILIHREQNYQSILTKEE